MANLRLTLPEGTHVCDGRQITFKAPCSCENISGLTIEGVTYRLVDAKNLEISSLGSMFEENALVSVLIDKSSNKAYILNGSYDSVTINRWEESD